MINEADITAFQFEVSVPFGISLTDCVLTNRKGNDHLVSFSRLDNGNYQIVAMSPTSQAFSGQEGTLVNLTFNVSGMIEDGTYELAIKNIELTNKAGVAINPVDVSATLTISNVKPGDTNGDGKISITDAVAIVNYILGRASANFVKTAADVNGDGKISITDAVGIVNKILKGDI